MKKILLTAAFAVLVLAGTTAPQRLTHPAPDQKEPVKSYRQQVADHHKCGDPKKAAEMEASRVKRALDLTDAQTKKVYKLFVKEMKSREYCDNKHPQERNGFKGRGHGPQMPADKADKCCRAEEAKKGGSKCMTRADRDAAMRKILDNDQYAKWVSMENRLMTGQTR